jgi:hypothetical protein
MWHAAITDSTAGGCGRRGKVRHNFRFHDDPLLGITRNLGPGLDRAKASRSHWAAVSIDEPFVNEQTQFLEPEGRKVFAEMKSREWKGAAFQALHTGEAFVIPNPWDLGQARIFAALGFKALATTSAGFAFTLGRLDGQVTLDEVVSHTQALDRATDLPVSVDLENGYGADPASVARAVSRIAEAGAVGGSIEDYDPSGHIYEHDHAVERIAAAAEAAHGL